MKHRRGVDISGRGRPIYVGVLEDVALVVGGLREWECVGARCGACEREAWLDRYDMQRKARGSVVLSDLAPRLRCRACGNRVGNKIILGKLPRD
jgi:hypothetical protein